jgi:hypothetical protein
MDLMFTGTYFSSIVISFLDIYILNTVLEGKKQCCLSLFTESRSGFGPSSSFLMTKKGKVNMKYKNLIFIK